MPQDSRQRLRFHDFHARSYRARVRLRPRRIGVAVGNTPFGSHIRSHDRRRGEQRALRRDRRVDRRMAAWRAVVGIPVHASGAEQDMTFRARVCASARGPLRVGRRRVDDRYRPRPRKCSSRKRAMADATVGGNGTLPPSSPAGLISMSAARGLSSTAAGDASPRCRSRARRIGRAHGARHRARSAFVGSTRAGRWIADRLAKMLPGNHASRLHRRVVLSRRDYNRSGLKPNTRATSCPSTSRARRSSRRRRALHGP